MRLLKILLIIVASLIILSLVVVIVIIATREGKMAYYGYVHMVIGFLTSILSVLFHLKSYQYYRQNKKIDYKQKLSKTLWIGSFCFGIFLLYVAFGATYSYVKVAQYDSSVELKSILLLMGLFFVGISNTLEMLSLKKRIAQGKETQEQLDEIDVIGDN